MNFLTTGEKIKSLRKKLGMRQQELEDINVTRAFISMIETGKRGLRKDTAKLIAEKLYRKAKSQGLHLAIDENYLLRTPSEDAEVYCYNKLNNFPTNDEIDVIMEIAKNYGLVKVEAMANKIIGDYSFREDKNTQAFMHYLISLDLYKETEERTVFSYLYYRLGLCKFNRLEYTDAISFFNRAEHYLAFCNNTGIEKDIIKNKALAYKNLNDYKEYQSYAERYLHLSDKIKDINQYAKAVIMKADSVYILGNDSKATSLIEEMFVEIGNFKGKLNWDIYLEIASLYLSMGFFERSLSYVQLAEDAVNNVDNIQLACAYLIKAKVYLVKNSNNEAILFCNKCLKLGSDNEALMVECYNILIHIYSLYNDFINLKNTYIKLLDILKDKESYKEEVLKLYSKLALLYLEQNDMEMCKKYLNMVS